jgi:predicted transposase YbfD/YdcC
MKSATSVRPSPRENPEMLVFDVDSLGERLRTLSDRRHRRGIRYRLDLLLVLLVLAKLGGADHPSAIGDWLQCRSKALRTALHLPWPRLPHTNTFRRIMEEVVSPEELETAFRAFVRTLPGVGRSALIAMDGKTVRGTIGDNHPHGEHLLCAYLPQEGVVLVQVPAGVKDNEISVAPTLLQALDLRGKIVMGDAMHTQRAVSVQIRAAGGDYIWLAKDNQPTLHADIATLFAPAEPTVLGGRIPTDFQTARTFEKSHGRLNRRDITVSRDLNGYTDWPDLAQVFQIERERVEVKKGKTTHEIVCGLTSLTGVQAPPKRLLDLVRSYWGIENGLHYRRDVTFQEDRTRMTGGNTGRIMAIVNNLVISLLRFTGATNLAHTRRLNATDLSTIVRLVTTSALRL